MENNGQPEAASLQFDTAEYAASQPAAMTCSACKRPITETYYAVGTGIVCDQCRGHIVALLTGGSKFKRVAAAVGLGLLAGLGGAAVWYAVRVGTGYEVGLIAILVGVMVGLAVRKGAKGRGGWFYQALAIALTYGCISAQYMPDIMQAFLQEIRKDRAAPAEVAKHPLGNKANAKAIAKEALAKKPAVAAANAEKPGVIKVVLAYALLLIVTFAMSLTVPFMGGLHNPIGLLIIGFALYEAWKINKKSTVEIAGPFQVSSPSLDTTGQ